MLLTITRKKINFMRLDEVGNVIIFKENTDNTIKICRSIHKQYAYYLILEGFRL